MGKDFKTVLKGRVWTFGKNVDTDIITPGKYLDNLGECKKHVLKTLDPEFPEEVQEGDIIVSDKNFGCGSSRETAPEILQDMGVSVIIAPSFGRIFYRNSFGIGLPLIESEEAIEIFSKNDEAEVNLETSEIKNLTNNKSTKGKDIPDILMDFLESGGILKKLKNELKAKYKAEKRKKKNK
ncbi:MAG: 3-isopropylmalate dehydratase [Candidatus Lokiarchaeota archaeon]|nr:3-isopropylmalate dehydratase [Candidatus Lokiarchaeota archaeon]